MLCIRERREKGAINRSTDQCYINYHVLYVLLNVNWCIQNSRINSHLCYHFVILHVFYKIIIMYDLNVCTHTQVNSCCWIEFMAARLWINVFIFLWTSSWSLCDFFWKSIFVCSKLYCIFFPVITLVRIIKLGEIRYLVLHLYPPWA